MIDWNPPTLVKFIAWEVMNRISMLTGVSVTYLRAVLSNRTQEGIAIASAGGERASVYYGNDKIKQATVVFDMYTPELETHSKWQEAIGQRFDKGYMDFLINPGDVRAKPGEVVTSDEQNLIDERQKVLITQMDQISLSEALAVIAGDDHRRSLMTFNTIFTFEP